MVDRKLMIFPLVFFFAAALVFSQKAAAHTDSTGTITVMVFGLKSDRGKVRIALYDANGWSSLEKKAVRRRTTAPSSGTAVITFEDIPFGEYAIALHHDENGNHKMDKYALGFPKEKYGFSNNVKATLGPPSFEKTKFALNSPNLTIQILAR